MIQSRKNGVLTEEQKRWLLDNAHLFTVCQIVEHFNKTFKLHRDINKTVRSFLRHNSIVPIYDMCKPKVKRVAIESEMFDMNIFKNDSLFI